MPRTKFKALPQGPSLTDKQYAKLVTMLSDLPLGDNLKRLADLFAYNAKSIDVAREIWRQGLANNVNALAGYDTMSREQRIMAIANHWFTGSFGVESIQSNKDKESFTDFYGLEYVNMGDSYNTTLVYDYHTHEFYVTSWGDMVESYPGRFGE